jgi:hypothetical protein
VRLEKFYFIGTRTRDLPACSILPQPTNLPCTNGEPDSCDAWQGQTKIKRRKKTHTVQQEKQFSIYFRNDNSLWAGQIAQSV